ncbi:MAG: VCBS repeat-containing protein [Planctomycetes bacterium]|nr:VCBS repeat-containing protein [Planctomycetota bacterium]
MNQTTQVFVYVFVYVWVATCSPMAFAQTATFGGVHRMVDLDGRFVYSLAVGDLDGDGDLDAVIGNANAYEFGINQLFWNDGNGNLRSDPARSWSQRIQNTTEVVLGDVDGDRDLDVLVINDRAPNELWLNDGRGVLTEVTATHLPAGCMGGGSAAFADLDGDGDLDAVLAWSVQSQLLENTGAGVFRGLPLPWPATYIDPRFALGDVDGDQDLDIVIANRQGRNLLFRNDGGLRFTDVSAAQLPADLESTHAVALGDVDGDSDLDILFGNRPVVFPQGEQDRLLLNDGTGTFVDATATHLPTELAGTSQVALRDFDGDGFLDAFFASGFEGFRTRLYRNDGTGRFIDVSSTRLPLGGRYQILSAMAVGDFDGDADLDVLLGQPRGPVRLLLNDGRSTFRDVTSTALPPSGDPALGIVLGDVDGDLDRDIVLTHRQSPARLLINDGGGVFLDRTSTSLFHTGSYAEAAILGDVDGDRDLDLVLCHKDPLSATELFSNDGTGHFTDVTASNLPFVFGSAKDGALADVDGDSDLDLFVANDGELCGCGLQNVLYLNDGNGVFRDVTATHLPVDRAGTQAVAFGDVDGDGDLDAMLANAWNPDQSALLVNDGNGVFTDATATNMPAFAGRTIDVVLGDLDGDLDLDALLVNEGAPHRLLVNDGTGRFSLAPLVNLPQDGHRGAAGLLLDVDGDGDLDAFVAGVISYYATSYGQRLYLNDGTGVFVDGGGAIPPLGEYPGAVAFGDVDGDRDLDVVMAGSQESTIYTNLTRQFVSRSLPRLGKPLTFDVYGEANGLFAAAFSLAEANLALPPLGTLRLDVRWFTPFASGALDPAGRASRTLLVPFDASLLGFPLYAQALVGPRAAFTNLEVLRFTTF